MLTQNQIEGGWTELKGKIKETWGQLNDNELKEFEGDVQQLIGLIQRKTGQAREKIEARLQEVDDQFRPMLSRATSAAKEYAQKTADSARESAEGVRDSVVATAEGVRDSVVEGHAQAEEMVRRHPMESVAVAFGAGIVAGVIVGLMVRSR